MFASLREGADRTIVARTILKLGVTHNIGLIFGSYLIRQLLKENIGFLEEIEKQTDRPLPFLVTSDPLSYDALDLFEQQLNIWNGANPSQGSLFRFLKETISMEDVRTATIAIWDSMIPSNDSMPKHNMRFDEFTEWLKNYYRLELSLSGKGGGQGLFQIKKT